ncbi:formate dehydrogenase family accessory protein FdhD [Nautilia profundicola AmH]|uniref:Sulfur carrier protein FdhD n=1 Tax=Nautilia profundicola (strain ATCC BAA-1463 / DSM 18972 / AmH) TaxID=598659 RepID=B9L5P8_NAUPA|nr:formate dehydrogenase accessory sulfurtransferase FdhD [Nautilia profundicola]ACM92911.1 formate dehydrogenase family accessory protein FdhD [Nautilia profundicola AmH]
MEPVSKLKIKKVKNGKKFDFEDTLIREIKTDIHINGKKVVSMMATPVDLEALGVGYLISEGIVNSIDDIEKIELKNEGLIIDVTAKADTKKIEKLNEEAIIVSGCGKSVTSNINIEPEKIEAEKITSTKTITPEEISKQMNEFYKSCPLYEKTGCVHTARIYFNENTYFDAEDIAQHSTVDKAVGKAIMAGLNPAEGIMMVSGRLSSEMIVKAVMHKIPILISRTATTCLGAKIADTFGLTLIGFARGDKMNIYTHDWRIEEVKN